MTTGVGPDLIITVGPNGVVIPNAEHEERERREECAPEVRGREWARCGHGASSVARYASNCS